MVNDACYDKGGMVMREGCGERAHPGYCDVWGDHGFEHLEDGFLGSDAVESVAEGFIGWDSRFDFLCDVGLYSQRQSLRPRI